MAIEALDLLYVPSRDVESDVVFYREVLSARVVEVATTGKGPRVVLADHLQGEAPILLHRTGDLETTLADLVARGLRLDGRTELPLGPCATFRSPGGQRLALYQLTRPEVEERFAGRADFG
jgi:hypothetical protein